MPNETAAIPLIPFEGGPWDGERLPISTLTAMIDVLEQVIEPTAESVPYIREGWLTQTERYRDTIHYVQRIYDLTQAADGPRYVVRA